MAFAMGWCQNPSCRKPYVTAVPGGDSVAIFLDKACSKRCKNVRKRQRLDQNRRKNCARPLKDSFTTLDQAIRQVVRRSLHIGKPLYPYQCDCQRWHLTSERKKHNKWAKLYPEIYDQLPVHMPL